MLFQEQFAAQEVKQEFAFTVGQVGLRDNLFHFVPTDVVENRAPIQQGGADLGILDVQEREYWSVEADLPGIIQYAVRYDAAHRIAQDHFPKTVANQVAGRNAVAELAQIAIEERRTILDRKVHRVQIVLVQHRWNRLLEEFIQHTIAQQSIRVRDFGERLRPVRLQERRELVAVHENVVTEVRILHERIRILQERITHDRPHSSHPARLGGFVRRPLAVDLGKMKREVIVIARVQLVRCSTTDRNSVAFARNGLHQKPMREIADCAYRRIMVRHQVAHLGKEPAGVDRDVRMPNVKLANRLLDNVLLLVTRVCIDNGEPMDVVVEDVLGDANYGIRVDAAAHAEGDRHIRSQTQFHRTNQFLASTGDGVFVGHVFIDIPPGIPVPVATFLAGCINPQHIAGRQFPQTLEEGRIFVFIECSVAVDQIAIELVAVDIKLLAQQRKNELRLGPERQSGRIPV